MSISTPPPPTFSASAPQPTTHLINFCTSPNTAPKSFTAPYKLYVTGRPSLSFPNTTPSFPKTSGSNSSRMTASSWNSSRQRSVAVSMSAACATSRFRARANLARITDALACGVGESGTPQSVMEVGVGDLSG